MRIEIKKQVMQTLLDKAANVMGGVKDITPIVKNFLIEASVEGISVIATDISLSVIAKTTVVRTNIVGSDSEELNRAIFPQMFYDIVKEASDDVMDIAVTGREAVVKCGTAEWSIKLMDVAEYPEIPTSACATQTFDKAQFMVALLKVKLAMSANESRQSLRMVDISEGRVRATDGVRLHQVEVESLKGINMQIPIAAVDDLIRLLKSPDVVDVRDIGFGVTEQLLIFQIHEDTFIINKVVYEFPDVETVILKPAESNDQLLQVNKVALRAAIRRVRITADSDTNAIVGILENNLFVVACRDKYGNTSKQSIDVNWPYDKRELLLNHNHFMDLITIVDGGDCKLYFGVDRGKRRSFVVLREDATIGILGQLRIVV